MNEDAVQEVLQRMLEIARRELGMRSFRGGSRKIEGAHILKKYHNRPKALKKAYKEAGPEDLIEKAFVRLRRELAPEEREGAEVEQEQSRRDTKSRKEQAPTGPEDGLSPQSTPAGLEEIAEQRRAELVEQLQANREALTQKLLDYLPTVEGRAFETVEESRAFVSELNLMLENAGQRLLEPKTGLPGYLFVLAPSGGPPGGYFAFKVTEPEKGKRRSVGSFRAIPPLKLVP